MIQLIEKCERRRRDAATVQIYTMHSIRNPNFPAVVYLHSLSTAGAVLAEDAPLMNKLLLYKSTADVYTVHYTLY